MKNEYPAFRQGMTIEEISEAGNRYIEGEWKRLYEELHAELTEAFRTIEDAAYGLYLDRLMPAVFGGLIEAGFDVMEPLREDDFVIGQCLVFRSSMEKWGSEDNRSRVFWNVVRDAQGEPIGALLTDIPHSHLKFDIPSSPKLYALAEHEREQISAGIRRVKGEGGKED
ncbi:DUF6022 family protein [Paenibacillus xanthanilyticus]|uniref:DUF6022 family protein n=1 Tax=Paenibacillus xanthanilyticus TaxID=1783531 RepID=A0ABV8JZ72_9BACL